MGYSFLDQGLVSGCTFVLNILLARWLPPSEYGAFAVAYTAFLFMSGFHSALILEPMSVFPSAQNDRNASSYLSGVVCLHFALTLSLTAVVFLAGLIVGDGILRGALWGLALVLPVVLLFFVIRRAYYAQTRPGQAAGTSAVYAGALFAGTVVFWLVGDLTAQTAVLLLGGASAVACGVSWRQLALGRRETFDALSRAELRLQTRRHWQYGRWIAAAAFISLAITQIQTFFVADVVGLDKAGVLRAMQTFSFPMAQLVVVTGYLGVPVLSREASRTNARGLWRKAVGIAGLLVLATGACAIVCIVLRSDLEGLIYAHRYRDWVWLIPIVVLWPVFSAAGSGFSMTLRALQRSQFYAVVGAVTIPVGVASGWLFTIHWGIAGAAASVVLGEAVAALLTVLAYLWWIRRENLRGNRPTTNALNAESSELTLLRHRVTVVVNDTN